jgi:cell wall-associated NlpC family hydrolase
VLADSILERGMSLIGTRYRFGGTTEAGFDCSGFIGYLFREAGMNLPRSTREMINVDAPKVARNKLKPGDLLFFSTNGRGRVSHAGIYLGDNQFIHSSSRRSGGASTAWAIATGARPSSKPSARWPWHRPPFRAIDLISKCCTRRGGVAEKLAAVRIYRKRLI